MKPAKSGQAKAWVLQHHDEITVSEGSQAPSTETEKGERQRRAYGPFSDKAAAEKYANNLRSKTLRAMNQE